MHENGFMNANKICKEAGKDFFNWKKNTQSKELIEALSLSTGIQKNDIMYINATSKNIETRGTYVHPDLIPHIASWASPEFAIKVSKIVNEYFIKKAIEEKDKLLQNKDDKIDKLLREVNELKNTTYEVLDNTKKIKNKLHIVSHDRVIHTKKRGDNQAFYLAKYNDKPKRDKKTGKIIKTHEYCVIRTKKISLNTKINDILADHPRMKIIHKIKYTPNSINLWIRICDELRRKGKIEGKNCNFNIINNFSEHDLIKFIEKTHNARLHTVNM